MQASFFLGWRGKPPFGGSTFGVTSFTSNVIWQWRTCFEKWGQTGYTLEQALMDGTIPQLLHSLLSISLCIRYMSIIQPHQRHSHSPI
jgi:hypothetical protein